MLTTIYLQAGAERVYLRDVSGLIADALHPELPQGTPRVLSYLQKEATDRNLAWQWCGINNNFPVSLTEQDVRELNAGVWRNLPPLEWRADTGEGPATLAKPLPEPEWEKYADAFEAAPPEGWRLIPVWRNLVFEQWVMNDEARKEWKRLLEQRAISGHLKPRSDVSGIPTPHLVGRQLMDAFLTVEDFTEFAGLFNVEVRVHPLYVRTALAAPLLAQLKALPPGESVTVQFTMGRYFERGTAPVKHWVEELEADAKRQAAGYFTINEAAQRLSESRPGLDPKEAVKRFRLAHSKRELAIHQSGSHFPLEVGETIRDFLDTVEVGELDAWLRESAGYGFPNCEGASVPLPAASATVTQQPAPDRGRHLKRAALIAENMSRWPTVERDLKDAATNGLSSAAKDTTKVGWWWEGSALDWARARQKVDEPSHGIAAWTSAIHRIKG